MQTYRCAPDWLGVGLYFCQQFPPLLGVPHAAECPYWPLTMSVWLTDMSWTSQQQATVLGGESGTVGHFIFFCHSTSLIQLRSLGTGCDHLVSLTSMLLSWSHSRRTTKVRFHGGRHNWGRSHEARVSRWPRATWETQVFENIKRCSNPADAVLPWSYSHEAVANMPWGKKQEVVCTGSRYRNVTENKRLTLILSFLPTRKQSTLTSELRPLVSQHQARA